MNDLPCISSLDEFTVDIPFDIKQHLQSQYNYGPLAQVTVSVLSQGAVEEEGDKGKETKEVKENEGGEEEDIREDVVAAHDNNNDDNGRRVNESRGLDSGSEFDLFIKSMKTAPQTTICRVNLLLSSVDEVLQELKENLANVSVNGRLTKDNGENNGDGHGDNDGEDSKSCSNSNEMMLFQVQRHNIFHDVIEIRVAQRPSISNNDTAAADDDGGAVTSLSGYSCPPTAFEFCKGKEELFSKRALTPSTKRQKLNFPQQYKVIICDRLCGEAVLRGSNIFVKGVLAAERNIDCGDKVCVYAHVNGKVGLTPNRGIHIEHYYGHCIFLGIGEAMCSRAQIFNQNTGLAVTMLNKIINVPHSNDNKDRIINYSTRAGPLCPSMNGILTHKMMLQNLPSCIVAHVLDPKPKDTIADLCCAPGGKTSHVASLVNNDATIVAMDKSRKKMNRTKKFFENMGASCITPIAMDSTKCVLRGEWKSVQEILSSSTPSEKDGLLDVKGFYPNSFDRIVLDPPCSALGLRPKLCVEIKSLADLNKYANYQQKFISCAVSLLKKGGILVYSTCTVNSCENEKMVRYILDFTNMQLLPIDIPIGKPGLPNCSLNDEERQMVRRFGHFEPPNTTDTIGFFIAKFRKC